MRLFTRRHKPLVAGAALAVLSLMLAAAISVAFAVRSQQSAARETKHRHIAERTNEQLLRMLTLADPHQEGGDITVAEMLEQMAERLDQEPELPEVEAQIRTAIGSTYLNQRRPAEASAQLSRAVELWRTIEPQGLNLAEALMHLGLARVHEGEGETGEAVYREAIALFEQHRAPNLESVRGGFLDVLIRRKKLDEAAQLAEQLMAAARQKDHPVKLIGRLRQLVKINHGRGAYDAALANLDEALSLVNAHLPSTHPMVQNVWLDISVVRQAKSEWPAALEASTIAYGIATQRKSAGTSDWLSCLNFHLAALKALGHHDKARTVLHEARQSLVTAHGTDHPHIAIVDAHLAKLADGSQ
jgi:tetratricopeptide (TPR) repeat protein